MIDGTLELPNILSLAQSLRGDDIYGKSGKYPKIMSSFTPNNVMKWVNHLLMKL